jgi:hypothetical protein
MPRKVLEVVIPQYICLYVKGKNIKTLLDKTGRAVFFINIEKYFTQSQLFRFSQFHNKNSQ